MATELIHFVTILFLLFLFLSSLNESCVATATASESIDLIKQNPFSPRASLVRYWNKRISNTLPKPNFLLAKASPLSSVESAFLADLASQNSLSTHLDSLCSLANLYCSFDSQPQTTSTDKNQDANFATYSNRHFSNYGKSKLGGTDSFKNYSNGLNSVFDSFIKYSGQSMSHSEGFTNYATDANTANATFGNYGANALGGSSEFKNYDDRVNAPALRFTTYNSDGTNHQIGFSSYSGETNAGSQTFTSYGKKGNGVPSEFATYSTDSNIIDSTFTGYGELGNGANDTFTSYGKSGNNPHNNFKNYGTGGNGGIDNFSGYRNGANVGVDTFQTYARSSNTGKVTFSNYGKTFNPGNDTFKDYGKGSMGSTTIGFKTYGPDRSFNDYNDKGVTFSGYNNASVASGTFVNKRWVEPGKFFRESMLKEGNVIVMPDIRDKMPPRSFLPRTIASKLPFASKDLAAIEKIFHATKNSTTERVITNTLAECEREASPGETKQCVGSLEDMIDFSVKVLGNNVVVRTAENVNGSKQNVMIGSVKGINGGEVTKSVSCHQSLYPYLLYYCHSVPKVRVYEAEILDVETKKKINHGVAVCHVDTSAWSPDHGAFVALGSGPGLIEVCHWIFENDMNWSIAD